ncbi:hypothetical protein Terro_3030 [Terriglobus roseus DSM 18391]|uniref:Uncharacterized protein n=1 Tax=Terriglobus roseus (strain DSM 18391 / NRRL B-41598 / KBS 63) TaxID=926566 RepID=I3ZJ44_TERRK|nr:hypothetical protein Terro_3030 [Terriglobus roseus DSM 18391]
MPAWAFLDGAANEDSSVDCASLVANKDISQNGAFGKSNGSVKGDKCDSENSIFIQNAVSCFTREPEFVFNHSL